MGATHPTGISVGRRVAPTISFTHSVQSEVAIPMLDSLIPIIKAVESGDKKLARRLLQPLLAKNPTADLWYLAAQACESPEHEIVCLQRALALEPMHGKARSRLIALRQQANTPESPKKAAVSQTAPSKPLPDLQAPTLPEKPDKRATKELAKEELRSLKQVKREKKKRSPWTYVGCGAMMLLSLTASYFVLTVIGSSLPSQIRALLTGEQGAVTEIEGTPIYDRADAIYYVQPSQIKIVERTKPSADALEPGYAHEYTFEARMGEELAIYVQFISMTAHRVSRNVAIFDTMGQDASNRCQSDSILQDDSGIIFICNINQTGRWQVRILGREGESTGAYTVAVQRFE
jgi:hypothetical protein